MTGSDAGCPQIYNNLGVEALWSLLRGPTSVAVGGGAFAMDFDKGYYAAKLAARGRYTAGAFSMQLSPSVLIALTEREDAMGNRANKDALYIPLMATYKPIPVLWLSLASGFKGPLDDLGDAWEIPGGVVMQYVFNPSVSVGGSYVFPKLVGAADEPPAPAPPATGFDYRRFNVWVTLTQGI